MPADYLETLITATNVQQELELARIKHLPDLQEFTSLQSKETVFDPSLPSKNA